MKFQPKGFAAYFPNIVVAMVRSGVPRRPNEFVFRVPKFLNKFDVQQYFEKLYKVTVTSVDTYNFVGRISRLSQAGGGRRYPEKKQVIITIKEEIDRENGGKPVPIFKMPPVPEAALSQPHAPYHRLMNFPKFC